MSAPQPPASGRKKTLVTVLVAALLGTAAGLAAVYGIGGLSRNGATQEADAACKGAIAVAEKLTPLARGEVAAFSAATTPRRLPELKFTNAEGKPITLADFRGRVTLLNLWATWCVPCRKEMPALDALEGKLGGEGFTVLALNLDTGDRSKPKKFLSEIGTKHLAYFEDPTTDSFQDLKRYGRAIVGLPTTVLIDRNGCELGVLPGPAEWASEDALKLIRAATGG
jgi:thiol-disulfide isomerase/thioredoxin